jgi:hypothetical protein
VYDQKPLFCGLGQMPKPKPKMANTVTSRNHISKGKI